MQQIAIHSVPRSGSTWLGELFNSHPDVVYKYQPLFSYAFKNRLSDSSTQKEIDNFFNELSSSKDDFLDQREAREKGKLPLFIKSSKPTCCVYKEVRYHYVLENMLRQTKDVKIIGLVRNPCSVINSWLRAPKEFRRDLNWIEIEEWQKAPLKNNNQREEYNGFEKWKEISYLFLRLSVEFPTQFKLVYYNELLNNTEQVMNELFTFCNLPFSMSTQDFIKESQNKNNSDAYSVFKKKNNDDDWKNNLNPKIIKQIELEIKDTKLEQFLYNEI